jgi:hypothetical protein
MLPDLDGIKAFLSLPEEDRQPLIAAQAFAQKDRLQRNDEEFELSEYPE